MDCHVSNGCENLHRAMVATCEGSSSGVPALQHILLDMATNHSGMAQAMGHNGFQSAVVPLVY